MPHARTAELGDKAEQRFLSHPFFRGDIEQSLSTASVVKREFEYTYMVTEVRRVLSTTIVPVSKDMAVVHTHDITDRRRAEARLRESIERYELSVRGTNDGLWDWNIETGETFLSERWKEILGFADDELAASLDTVDDLVHPDDRDRTWKAARAHLDERIPYDLEFRMRRKDGTYAWIHARGQATWDEAGKPLRMAGAIRDITEERETEQEVIAVIESECLRIGHDLHDGLGQELTGISLGLKTLCDRLASDGSAHERAARSLAEMVRKSIVDVQRIARVLSPGFSAEVRLDDTLKALAAEVNQHSGIECRLKCSSLDCDADVATHMLRVAQESVNNALRHSGADKIMIKCERRGNSLVLEVLDDGVGIAPENERAEGLGLRSMRYRARMLNGTLDVGARPEGGTAVVCTCPLES